MSDLCFLVLHHSSPDRLGIRDAFFCGPQMEHALQLTVAAGVADLVRTPFANQVIFTNCRIGRPHSS